MSAETQPLPCPLCSAKMDLCAWSPADAPYWRPPMDSDCLLVGTALNSERDIAAWNRRAPAEGRWQSIVGEIEKAPWRHVVIGNAGTTEALLIYCDDKGEGWFGFNTERAVTIQEIVETGPVGQFFATHYAIVTDPGATPAPPPADAAMREALAHDVRMMVENIDVFFEPWGAWKTAWWEDFGEDGEFSAEGMLRAVRKRLAALAAADAGGAK